MSTCWQRVLTLAGMLSLLLPPSARAQTFTNSATLNATLSGTNLVITYSLMNTQGWVTLFQAGSVQDLATRAQPFDLAPAPGSGQGQFTVPINLAAPSQFYRLLLEQWPSRGKVLIFTNGSYNFAAMAASAAGGIITTSTPVIYNTPQLAWVDNLGAYDSNGIWTGSNSNHLIGKYGDTEIMSADEYAISDPNWPNIPELLGVNNDFSVDYSGQGSAPNREAILWSSEAQFYYNINDYRSRILNNQFIDSLGLSGSNKSNLKDHQFRPDLSMGGGEVHAKPTLRTLENLLIFVCAYFQRQIFFKFPQDLEGLPNHMLQDSHSRLRLILKMLSGIMRGSRPFGF